MKKLTLIPFLLLASCCTGCLYEMPNDDTADVRPQTNNSSYINQTPDTNMPKFNY